MYYNIYILIPTANFIEIKLCDKNRNCKNLQYLSLAFCVRLTDRAFSFLNSNDGLKGLIYIDLSGCTNITPIGCSSLARNCDKLESLIFNHSSPLTDQHFISSGRWFTKLTEIIIMDSPNLTDESFRYLTHATHLRTLKLNENRNLTDATFKYLTKSCTELRHVSITDCERISDGTLKCLAGLKYLSILNLADCIRYSCEC